MDTGVGRVEIKGGGRDGKVLGTWAERGQMSSRVSPLLQTPIRRSQPRTSAQGDQSESARDGGADV